MSFCAVIQLKENICLMKKALLLSSILFGAFGIVSYDIININIIFLQTTVTPKVDDLHQEVEGIVSAFLQANRVTKWLTPVLVTPLDICNDIWRPKKRTSDNLRLRMRSVSVF